MNQNHKTWVVKRKGFLLNRTYDGDVAPHPEEAGMFFPSSTNKAYSSQQPTNKLVILHDLGECGAQAASPGGAQIFRDIYMLT